MSKNNNLPQPPNIQQSSQKGIQKSGIPIHDSLRFSYDFDRDSVLTYSQDGKDIDFQFEDYPERDNEYEYKNHDDKNQTMQNSAIQRKLGIFQKYRHNNEGTPNRNSDIVESFDKIFQLNQNKNQQQNSPTKHIFKKKLNTNTNTTNNPNSSQQQKIIPPTFPTTSTTPPNYTKQPKLSQQTLSSLTNNNNNNTQKSQFILGNIVIPTATTTKTPNIDSISQSNSINLSIKDRIQMGISGTSSRSSFDPFNQSYLGLDNLNLNINQNININQINQNINTKNTVIGNIAGNLQDSTLINQLSNSSNFNVPQPQVQVKGQGQIQGQIQNTNTSSSNTPISPPTNTNINPHTHISTPMLNKIQSSSSHNRISQPININSNSNINNPHVNYNPHLNPNLNLPNLNTNINPNINNPSYLYIQPGSSRSIDIPSSSQFNPYNPLIKPTTPLSSSKISMNRTISYNSPTTPINNPIDNNIYSHTYDNNGFIINNNQINQGNRPISPGNLNINNLQNNNNNRPISPGNIQNNSNPNNISNPNLNPNLNQNPNMKRSYLSNQNQSLSIHTPQTSRQLRQILSFPIYQQQLKYAPFMRNIRKMNSTYPNFNHPNINTQAQTKFCNTLATAFYDALIFLQRMTDIIFKRYKQPKLIPQKLLKIDDFLNSKWQVQRLKQKQQINSLLKPRINFPKAQVQQHKIRQALANYKQVIIYYRERKMNLTNQQGIKDYFRIRQKFWSLQKNFRSISQDLYQLYPATDYPQYYYQYLKALRSQLPSNFDQKAIERNKQILSIVIQNQQRGQRLSCSQVGQAVRVKLERQLKFLCPF